jgi:hypothetical protein
MEPADAARVLGERLDGAGLPASRVAPVEPSLEDVFLDVAERSAR